MSYRRLLQGVSFAVLAGTLAVIAYGRLHGSSLKATALRVSARVQAYGEPKPYEARVFIPIRFDKQDHSLSCEAATLKMLLSHRGIEIDESELIARVGFDHAPHTWLNGREAWGDPNQAYVGNIDGRMMYDGYGVYWQPIARVANAYRPAEDFQGWTAADLVGQLQDGNPVMVWGCLGSCTNRTWLSSDGTPVTAVTYEHTFVVNGFSGIPEKPDGFWLVDPIYGRRHMTISAFMRMWDTLGRSGVIVY